MDRRNASLTEGQVQELLRREQAGNLSDSARSAMSRMRSAGNFPDPLPQQSTAQKIVRQSALPIIGGALGGAVGTLAAPVTAGIVNPVTGAMAGSALGELGNQALGITEPSAMNVGLSAAGPAVPGAMRGVVNTLPGAAAGLQKSMQTALGSNMERVLGAVAPAQQARQLWQSLMSTGKHIPVATGSLKTTLDEIGREVDQLVLPAGVAGKLVKSLKSLVSEETGTKFVPLDQFRANMSELGRIVRTLEETGGRASGQAKQLYRAMWDDLNAAVERSAPEVKDTLRAAVDATKREAAEDFLRDAVTKSVSYRLGTRQVDTNGLLTRIERNKELLTRWLPEEEINALKETLVPWAKKTPQMPSAIPRSSTDKLLGAATGADLIARLLMSSGGREAVRGMQTQTFDQAVNAVIQGAVSASDAKTPSPPAMDPPDLSQMVAP